MEAWTDSRWEAELQTLMDAATAKLQEHPDAQQAVAVRTARNNIHVLTDFTILSGSVQEEEAFIQNLEERGDTEVETILAMFQGGQWPTVTSEYFSLRLLEANAKNEEAAVFLWDGSDGCGIKRLKTILPPSNKHYLKIRAEMSGEKSNERK